MKKLLIATDSFLPRWDGIASFLAEVLPRLKKEYEITIIAPQWSVEDFTHEGVHVLRFPLSKRGFGDFILAKPSYRLIRHHVKEADLIWTQTIGPIGFLTIMAARQQKKPVAAFIHSLEWELFSRSIGWGGWLAHFFTQIFARWVYNRCTLLMVPSLEVAEILALQEIWTKKHVVPLGIDTQRFFPPENKDEAKKRIGIDPQEKVIGFIGRIAREKDLLTLYDAFERVRVKHKRVHLLIVGDGLDEIKNKMKDNLHVTLAGMQQDVVPYLQAMDIFCLPSLTETTSLATLEAMACGCAVIATPVGSIKKYLKDKKNGYLFPKGNALVLSLKLDWLLKNSYVRESIGKAARQTVKDGYIWGKTIREIKEALVQL
ncbi:MAG: glycosyltransferase [Nanoarchaeota archaeon]